MFDVVCVQDRESLGGRDWLLVRTDGQGYAFVSEQAGAQAYREMAEAMRLAAVA